MQRKTDALTPDGKIVWPALFEPESYNGSDPYYKAVLLFERDADFTEIKQAIAEAAAKKFPGKDKEFYKKLRKPLREGNEKAVNEHGLQDTESFYYNRLFMNVKSKYQPQIVDKYNQPITDPDVIYGGCIVRAYLSFFGFDHLGNKGISTSLRAIVKVDDGEPIGGGKIDTSTVFAGVIQEVPKLSSEAFAMADDIMM